MCAVALARRSLELLVRGSGEALPHRAVFEGVPDVAFHATYMGQLLGLYLAHRAARVRHSVLLLPNRTVESTEYTAVTVTWRNGVEASLGGRCTAYQTLQDCLNCFVLGVCRY